jgi:hypothetical protein
VHVGNQGKEPLNVLRVETAGSLTVVFESLSPSLSGCVCTDAPLEPDCQELGILRPKDFLGIGTQVLKVEAGDIDVNA